MVALNCNEANLSVFSLISNLLQIPKNHQKSEEEESDKHFIENLRTLEVVIYFMLANLFCVSYVFETAKLIWVYGIDTQRLRGYRDSQWFPKERLKLFCGITKTYITVGL